jgi:glycine betaine/proline transport system permease protein
VAIAPIRDAELSAPGSLSLPVPHQAASPWRNRLLWAAGVVVAAVIGLQLTGGFPESLTLNVAHHLDSVQLWVIDHQATSPLFTSFLNPIKDAAESVFEGLTNVLLRMTFLGVIVGFGAFAAAIAGWRMGMLALIGISVMGVLGLWEESMQTLSLVTLGVLIALAIGIPLGIWAGRRDAIDKTLRPLLDAAQTVPAYSYLLPLVLFFGIGAAPALIATVIFALPPAVRLTSLGIRGVPDTTLEVAGAFGSTKRQTLRKVQLPMAKPSVMLGVNQTIMMALGMVVIAAIVGVPGLGREVLNALRVLNIGQGFNAGVAIVAMAIVLDRVSYAWSVRDRKRRSPDTVAFGRTFPRWQVLLGAALVTVIAIAIGRQVLRQQDWPAGLTFSLTDVTNTIVDWVKTTFSGITAAISRFLVRYALDPLYRFLINEPWWVLAAGVAVLAWRVSRRASLAIFCLACIYLLGALGMWEQAMDTLSQVLVAASFSVVIAIPLGVWSAKSDGAQRAMKPILDTMQTMPAFVYLVPVVAMFELGRVPGVIASIIYALPPCIRLTDLGIRQVSSDTVEAAESYGTTSWQLLRKVQLPLARPSILLGINQMIMMVLSVVIIAGLIGGGGLGYEAVAGLTRSEIGRGVTAGVSILLLAIVIDRITQAMGMERRSMRGPVGTGGIGWWTRVRAIAAPSNVDNAVMVSGASRGEGDG